MTNVRSILLASAASLAVAGLATPAMAADQVLNGAISSPAGEKLGGVTVSAKQDGSTITTSVYTDDTGNYYFPPLPAGKYQVWAQALSFETTKASIDLAAAAHQDLVIKPIADAEQRIRQLPSELLVAALPEDNADDARIKKVFTNQCTGCHTPGYPLQFRFDEPGWNKIINLMKVIPGTGVYPGPGAKANGIIDFNQKQLAAYLARARGPGESSMKFKPRPRPTGEAARAVWTTYELPLNPGAVIPFTMIGRQGSALCRPWPGDRIAGAAITERALSHKKITSHFRRAGETSRQLGGHPWIEAVQAPRMCSARVSYWSGAPCWPRAPKRRTSRLPFLPCRCRRSSAPTRIAKIRF